MRDINFFTPYKTKGGSKENYVTVLIILLGVVIISSFSVNATKIVLLNKEIQTYQDKLNEDDIKDKVVIAEEVNRQLEALNSYKSGLNTILNSIETRDIVSNILLNQIDSTVPSNINFKSVNINNNTITIQGVSTDRQNIGELQYNLKSLSSIKTVHVDSISGSESLDREYTFNIKCYLNGGGN